ncbi:ubiquitin-like domain-containing protein [Streptomyces fradiae]|uniref:ubiquitin-like domain-containing protein n=3 Tax=Streptomyces TaxID=1883 RepID=UPI0027E51974|nr:ubiquitin-like domain-containing protein [Streptomyces fradiae]
METSRESRHRPAPAARSPRAKGPADRSSPRATAPARAPRARKKPAGRSPGGTTPADRSPRAEVPADRPPGGKSPDGRSPHVETPSGRSPGKAPSGRSSRAGKPADRQPRAKAPSGRQPGAKAPTAKAPSGRQSAAKAPTAKAPSGRQSAAKAPTAKAPTAAAPAVRPGLRWYVPRALVGAGFAAVLAAGGVLAADHKAVRLTVDGAPRTLHTFADDVGELLADEGIAPGAHDRVAPGPDAPLSGGDEVAVRYGRPLRLDVDGRSRRLWTTARTVDEALRGLGVRAEGARLSVSRTAPIRREGLALAVRTERALTVRADGRERTVRTHAATVAAALRGAGITLGALDTTSVPPGAFPRDGQTVTVRRVADRRTTRHETVPYAVRHVEDPGLYEGTEVVDRPGRTGLRRLTYVTRTVDGVPHRTRETGSELVREPVARIVRVGTRTRPRPSSRPARQPRPQGGAQAQERPQAPAPAPAPARSQAPAAGPGAKAPGRPASVAGADHLNWAALAQCESGGRPDAVDPSGTYGGLYQFDARTWASVGGSGLPQHASAAEQTYRAKKLYAQRGASPWPHCGRRLYR